MGTAAGRFPGRDDGEALTPSPSPLLNHTSSAPSGCWREVTESTYRRPRPKKDDCEERPPQGTTSSRRVAGGKREERLQGTYDVSYRKYDIHDCWYAHALYRRHGFLRAQHYEGGRDGGGGGGGGGGAVCPEDGPMPTTVIYSFVPVWRSLPSSEDGEESHRYPHHRHCHRILPCGFGGYVLGDGTRARTFPFLKGHCPG